MANKETPISIGAEIEEGGFAEKMAQLSSSISLFYLLICSRAVRLPHILPLDLAMLRLLLLILEESTEGALHESLGKEKSSFSVSQEPEYRHYQQMSSLHLL